MPHRIILFRGMNTGGVRAPVAEQRAMAEAMGLKNPRTLQASGNLVVESGKATAALEARAMAVAAASVRWRMGDSFTEAGYWGGHHAPPRQAGQILPRGRFSLTVNEPDSEARNPAIFPASLRGNR